MSTLSLGTFRLDSRIGHGGAGVVYGGTHPGQGVPVAVKVLRPGADVDGFRNEVQAVAGLYHPGVVLVFDHGVVPESAAVPDQDIVAGAPWLAMEYASEGSLKDSTQKLRWRDVRGVLLSVLDALAHAHARGVVHRDIKPGNILVGGKDDLRPGVKLADFGLAHGIETFDEVHQVTGTPVYMAPEQFRGAWRSFGPWTDLYSLGIVAWEMVTGRPPYVDRNVSNLGVAHVQGVLPPLRPEIPIPEGLEGWLRRMLVPQASERFQRAADAAWALHALREPDDTGDLALRTTSGIVANPTVTLDDTLLLGTGMHTTEAIEALSLTEEVTDSSRAVPVQVPPVPATWKRPTPPSAPMQLVGAGLNLFGLRSVPLVDRVRERDRMWDGLIDVAESRSAQLLLLQGAAGNGKTRLVDWIAQRAHEVGGAAVLKAIHGPTGGPMDGLEPMVARHFRCVGLNRTEVEAHLALHPDVPMGDDGALAELVEPAAEGDATPVRLETSEERWVVVERVIRELARTRSVILWLDDLQWGPDAIAFMHWLLERPSVGPVLILATAQEEALGDLPGVRLAIDSLLDHPSADRLSVGPLPPGDREELVHALLGLAGPLAQRLADRTGGNPLFTVQLVGDWVARGVLVPGRDGFHLKPGERAILPDDLHQVWSERVDRILETRPASQRAALEFAAALGQEVDAAEHDLVCAQRGIAVPQELIDVLIGSRLANPTDEGFAFSHGMLRESLQRVAREQGRWADLNRDCALALSALRQRGMEIRLGRHWFAAREYPRAAELLRRGASTQRKDGGDARQTLPALALAEDAMKRAQVPQRDARWGDLWLERALTAMAVGQLDEAMREARRTLTHARRYRWNGLVGQAWSTIGQVWRHRGDLQQALDALEKAALSFTKRGDDKRLADALVSIAHAQILGGQITEATATLARARSLMTNSSNPGGLGRVVRFEGDLARLQGEPKRAWALFDEAEKLARRAGLRRQASTARHGKAEMDRLMGNLDRAEAGYRAVINLKDATGAESGVTRLNLGLCLIGRKKYAEAREQLESVLQHWTEQRRRGYLAVAHISLVPAVAGLGDWAALDQHLDEFQYYASSTGMTDIDTALATHHAAELAESSSEWDRARRCWEICANTWDALANHAERDAALDRAGALENR